MKKRLDRVLVERGLAGTREKAQAMIMAGLVLVEGQRATKAGMGISEALAIQVKEGACPYVSRGGVKLEGALKALGLDVSSETCVDIGASTGGFTHCLLLRGARRVYAVDVDTHQLAWQVRQDPRVVAVERNARFLTGVDIGEPAGLVTIDASFISLTMILPQVPALLRPGGNCLALVKPQFEAGRGQVGKGGIVRDAEEHRRAVEKCSAAGEAAGLLRRNTVESAITGREGNREFFILFQKP